MPVILRIDGFDFYFFSNEGQEPAHIHIRGYGKRAKFWLDPVGLALNSGYNVATINKIRGLVEENQALLLEA